MPVTFDDTLFSQERLLTPDETTRVSKIWQAHKLSFAPNRVTLRHERAVIKNDETGEMVFEDESTVSILLEDDQVQYSYDITEYSDGRILFDKSLASKNKQREPLGDAEVKLHPQDPQDSEARRFVDSLAEAMGAEWLKKGIEAQFNANQESIALHNAYGTSFDQDELNALKEVANYLNEYT